MRKNYLIQVERMKKKNTIKKHKNNTKKSDMLIKKVTKIMILD